MGFTMTILTPNVLNGQDNFKKNPTPITSRNAFESFLATLKPVNGSEEIWYKVGKEKFYVADSFDPDASLWSTRLEKNTDPKSRVRVRIVGRAFPFLRRESETKEGGILYLKNQPQGLPLKDNVIESNRIVSELDKPEDRPEQWKIILDFQEKSGLLLTILDSGSKSLHNHLRVTNNLPVDRIQYFTRLFAIAVMGDPVMENPHQPVRIPGFTRNEKGKEQKEQLFYETGKEYSESEILVGFKKFFEYKGLAFPDKCPHDWFGNVIKKLIKNRDFDGLKLALEKGYDQWENERQQENERRVNERNENAENRRVNGWTNEGETLIDAVNQLKESLGSDAFTIDNSWKFSNADHARGCCPFHPPASRNSAYIRRGDRGWSFHCPTCTHDSPIDPFLYHLSSFGNVITQYPTGKDYVTKAEDFLRVNGATIPEWKPKPQRKHYKFNNLSTQKIEDKKEYPRYPKGFGISKFDVIEFEGSHSEEEQKWANKGYCVINVSGTGTGKSTATNDLINPDGIDYIHSDPKNPKAENIKEKFLPPPSRTQYGHTTARDGRTVQATIDTDRDNIIGKGNCDYTPSFIDANNKGYPTYDGATSALCSNCSVRNKCRIDGFLAQWEEYIKKEKYRSLHPSVLSACGDLSQKTGVIDELGSFPLTKVIRTKLTDLGTDLLHYRKAFPAYADPIFYSFIEKVYLILDSLFNGDKGSRYGTKINSVIDALKSQLSDDIIALDESKDNLIGLLEVYGINLHGLVEDGNSFDRNENAKRDHKYSGNANKLLGRRHAEETQEKIKNAPARVFPSIVKAIFGDNKIALRIAHNELLVTVSCVDDYKVLNNYKYLIIKDSTLSLENIKHYGINRPIVFIKKKTDKLPLEGQTIKQYKLHGIGSTDIGDIGINRIKLTQKQIESIIGFQIPWINKRAWLNDDPKGKRTQSLEGEWYWGKDNRASNEFKDARHMGSIGFPIPNIGATEDEFLVLNDGIYDKEKFDEYLIGKTFIEIIQDMGRQRSALCEDESVHHFITPIEGNNKVINSLLDLSPLEELGAKIEIIDILGFCPLAGDENEVTFYRILEAAWDLLNQKAKPTESAIAELMTVNGHKIGETGVSNAVNLAGYKFKDFTTKLRKLHSAYVLTYRASGVLGFGCIFPNLYRAWLSEDTTTEIDFSDVLKPKVKPLDLVKEAVNALNAKGNKVTQPSVIEWLKEEKGITRSQQSISKCLKSNGIDHITELVSLDDDMGMTAAALDIPTGQNKTILEGKNQIIDTTTDLIQTPLESRPMFKVGDRVYHFMRGESTVLSVTHEWITIFCDEFQSQDLARPSDLTHIPADNLLGKEVGFLIRELGLTPFEGKSILQMKYGKNSLKELSEQVTDYIHFRDYLVTEVTKKRSTENANRLNAA